jgi:hypothetical protein
LILFAIALPGRFAAWCAAAIERLAALHGGDVVSIDWPPVNRLLGLEAAASSLEEVARALIDGADHIVLLARQPDEKLRQALADGNARFLLALDDPCAAAADLLGETGTDPRTAVRAIATSCPMVMPFGELPGALRLHADAARSDPSGALGAIAAHFGIAVDPAEIATIAAELATLAAAAAPPGGETAAHRLSAAEGKMLDGALAGYQRWFRGDRLDQLIWTRELFHRFGDDRAPTAPVDVAGSGPVLVFGPYVHLPAGAWSARIVLGFSPETAPFSFLVDVYTDRQLAVVTLQPGPNRVHTADLNFSLPAPSGTGVEVRLLVTSETASGRIAFGRVVLQPLGAPRPDAAAGSEDFASVLEL